MQGVDKGGGWGAVESVQAHIPRRLFVGVADVQEQLSEVPSEGVKRWLNARN